MEGSSVIFMGGCFRDLVACSERFPKVGETIIGSKFHMGFGGKAANAAVMCARMGGNVALIAKLGDDDNGKAYKEALSREAIDTNFIYTDPKEPSGVAHIMVETSSGNNVIIIVPGSNMTLSVEETLKAEDKIKTAKLISFGLEGNHDAIIAALKLAKKHGVRTMTNAAPARADLDQRIYEYTDILCVNETEAQIILGKDDPIETEVDIEQAMSLLLLKCPTIVITLGSKGAAIASQNDPKPIWVKAEKAEKVVDTTGAGDSFVGTMCYYLAYHPELELKEVVKRSCAVATISVQKEGTQTSFPYKHDLPKSMFLS